MISYEVYKLIHIICLVILAICSGEYFSKGSPSKMTKILCGVASLLIFVAGMGMMARLGIGHGEGWPTWIILKIVFWLLVAALIPILGKRLPEGQRSFGLGLIFFFLTCAIYTAIFKPFV